MADKNTIGLLLFKYSQGTLTEEERQQLEEWKNSSSNNQYLLEELDKEEWQIEKLAEFHPENKKALASQILLQVIRSQRKGSIVKPSNRVHVLKTVWLRTTAAAILLLFISAAVVYLGKNQRSTPSLVQSNPAPAQNDVAAPLRPHATLTLADGQKIVLDTAHKGMLANHVIKTGDGQLQYSVAANDKVEWHTLTVPRGSQVVELTLADGTLVWMNAASMLRYPTGFDDAERKVELTGEAYFEVTKDPNKKFMVKTGAITTEVLGTHFNVNTYPDEKSTKVTLLEGIVKVIGGASNVVIKPGSQAEYTSGVIKVNQSVDLERVMAWKNGVFDFEDKALQQVMRELSRWYDLEIVYENDVPGIEFGGKIGMDLSLSQVLKGLESSGLHFRIEKGKRLIVMP